MFVSIRHKLGLLLFLSVFVLTLLVVSALQYHSYLRLRHSQRQTSEAAIRAAMESADKWILQKMNTAQALAHLAERPYISSSDLLKDLKKFATENELAGGVYMGLENGEFIDSTDWLPPDDYDCRKRPWYQKAGTEAGPVFVPPYVDAMTGKVTVTFAAPVFETDRSTIRGVVAFDIFLDELKSTIENIFMTRVDQLIPFYLPDNRFGMLVKTLDMDEGGARTLAAWISRNGLRSEEIESAKRERFMVVHGQLSMSKSVIVYPVSLRQLMQPLLIQALIYFGLTIAGLWIIFSITRYILGRYVKRIENLNKTTKEVAEGNFDIEVKKSSEDEIGELADSFNKMIKDLKEYMKTLEVTVREKESIAKELDIAAQVQEKALPREMPKFGGLEIAAKSFPAKAVGGDYYDFVYPGEDKIGLIIADAAGKGISASLYMSNVRSAFRVISLGKLSPAELLRRVNDYISKESALSEGMFITYVFAIYDGQSKKLTYSNAGHFPPLLYSEREQSYKPMDIRGLPIGVMGDKEYPEEAVDFHSGDVLVMYTDGVIDAFNFQKKTFGTDNLQQVVQGNAKKSAADIIGSIGKAINDFVGEAPQHDDMTIVVVKAR